MVPDEYAQVDSVRLNGTTDDWWCDFDLSAVPVWGTQVTKGKPGFDPPHADGELPVPMPLGPVDFTMTGCVYGDRDQTGAAVTPSRVQLKDNLDVLMALVASPGGDGTRPFTYVLEDRTYTGDVIVTSCKQGVGVGPFAIRVALTFHLSSGTLTLVGS